MMVTVQEVYDMAIHLMDEQDETTGMTTTVDTKEYKLRTISILNSVIPALVPYSGGGGRPIDLRINPPRLLIFDYREPDFTQAIPLDDTLSLAVLPYYLASQLLSSENEDLASWFMTRYRESFLDLRHKVPEAFEPIRPVYGLF
jgi:hypothetical protein